MKHEWKKHEKYLYGAKITPGVVDVPTQQYIMISGEGNPNNTDFSDKVSALYSLAYAIKMNYKAAVASGNISREVQDFTVYPLEGIWKQKIAGEFIKENLEYTIMIRQPDYITVDMVQTALERVKVKKPTPLYGEIRFDTMQDGKCIEILHVGSFDDELTSFEKMDRYAKEQGLKRSALVHREIYLNNANRVEKSKQKTILRYQVQ